MLPIKNKNKKNLLISKSAKIFAHDRPNSKCTCGNII